ncbi:MAG: hypothetical protein LUD15_09475 [Bacteroides sp.]|nr:hypothetical protein [Bacteroides sp.]
MKTSPLYSTGKAVIVSDLFRVAACLFFLFVLPLQAGNILFDHIDMRSGLSNPTVNAIYQDENDVV